MSATMQNSSVRDGEWNATRTENEAGKSEKREQAGKRPFTAGTYTPRVNVQETADALLLFADLPGVKPEDVSLDFQDEHLILQARCAPRHAGKRPLYCQYGVGDYSRTFRIAEPIDPAGIEAHLKDGVLAVRVPKAEAMRPKKISVKGG